MSREKKVPMTAITVSDRVRLENCEHVIRRGLKTFVEVGVALAEVRDSRLYRERYWNFADYCDRRWKLSRPRAYQLIDEAQTVKALPSPLSKILDNSEKARAVAALPAADRVPVLKLAAATAAAEGRNLTARDIREAAEPADLSAMADKSAPAAATPFPLSLSLAQPALEIIRRLSPANQNEKAALEHILKEVQQRLSQTKQ
jgi:hypothetical protein